MNEKMMWVSPKTQIQQFAANDRVSACLRLTCMLPTEENDNGQYGAGRETIYNSNGGSYKLTLSDQWVYNETETGYLHREHECGAGASIVPGRTSEDNNQNAIIDNIWLDGYALSNDGKIIANGTADNSFDNDTSFKASDLVGYSAVNSIVQFFAKWTTIYSDFFGTKTYTHVGYATWNDRRNHS